MKMHYGPRILITNNKTANKQQEDLMCQKLESYRMEPIILATTKIELEVDEWYKTHSKKKLKTQTEEEELQFFPAPPVLLSSEGEE